MKHLLIILSILLLSSFVTSCDKKEETIYRWETSSGIVWKRFGDKDTHRVYKGEWKNEKLNGLGVMTYPDGHKYVGEWKNGKYHWNSCEWKIEKHNPPLKPTNKLCNTHSSSFSQYFFVSPVSNPH